MLISLLFIFKCIIFAENSPTVQQSPDLTPRAANGAPPLTTAGAGSDLTCGASYLVFFLRTQLFVELGVTEEGTLFQLK